MRPPLRLRHEGAVGSWIIDSDDYPVAYVHDRTNAQEIIDAVNLYHCGKDHNFVFDWDKGHCPGAKVFDALGNEYHEVTECNIRTGKIVKHTDLRTGGAVVYDTERIRLTVEYAPAPLRVEFD